jgi:ABC-type uncharacterized transport system involved in gliding motility auxiliary subunit
LSPKTKKVLNTLKQDVMVTVFNNLQYNDPLPVVLSLYSENSSFFKYRFLDPAKELNAREKYGVKEIGAIIIESSNQKPIRFNYNDLAKFGSDSVGNSVSQLRYEQVITKSLESIFNDSKSKCLMTVGHRENSALTSADFGITTFRDSLNFENIAVKFDTVSKSLLKDADLLIVSGPRDDFSYKDILKIKQYISAGGSALFLVDPYETNGQILTNIHRLMQDFDIRLEQDLVIDQQNYCYDFSDIKGTPLYPRLSYDFHPIVNEMANNNLDSYFFKCRSLTLPSKSGKSKIDIITKTFPTAWGETSVPLFSYGSDDNRGPLVVGCSVETAGEGRVAIFGDSDFIRNKFINLDGNKDLVLNTINWLLYKERDIGVRPKIKKGIRVKISKKIANIYFWIYSVGLPLLLLLVALIIYFKKKRFSFKKNEENE